MVAITVILAAVIGTFVLGLGGQVSQTAPQASITVEQVNTADDYIEFRHGGSDDIAFADLNINFDIAGTSGTLEASDASSSIDDFTTADSLFIDDDGTDVNAYLGGTQSGSGTPAYSTDVASALSIDSGDDYEVTFVDAPSGQIIAEKTGSE